MEALIQFFGRILPPQKEDHARDYQADNLTQDDGSYLRELADQERAGRDEQENRTSTRPRAGAPGDAFWSITMYDLPDFYPWWTDEEFDA